MIRDSFTLNQPSFEGILQLKLLASFPAMLRCARVLVTSPSISARIFQPFSLSTRYRHNKAGKGDRKNPKKPWWVQSKKATNSVDPVVLEAEVREKLQSEQRAVLDLVLAGHNVFITGFSDIFRISTLH